MYLIILIQQKHLQQKRVQNYLLGILELSISIPL